MKKIYTKSELILKTRIRKTKKKCLKILNLENIPSMYNNKGIIAYRIQLYQNLNVYNEQFLFDIISLLLVAKQKNHELFKKYKLNSLNKRINFIICHEIGHYYQWKNHKKWSYIAHKDKKEKIRSNKINNEIEYRNHKIEKFADRIAFYLIKRI